MIELLKEQLKEYTDKYNEALTAAERLSKQGKDISSVVKKAAGLKMLIEHCENDIERFKNK